MSKCTINTRLSKTEHTVEPLLCSDLHILYFVKDATDSFPVCQYKMGYSVDIVWQCFGQLYYYAINVDYKQSLTTQASYLKAMYHDLCLPQSDISWHW